MKIFKYALETLGSQVIAMPKNARLLSVQMQHEVPMLWALVDPGAEVEEVRIRIFGTGHPVEEAECLTFLDTIQMSGGALIFHVFYETA